MTAHHFSYTRRNYKVVLFVVAAYPMKLVQYLQKTMSLSRRECTGMVQEGVISINNKKVEDFSATIALGDQLHIILPDKTIREKTIEKIPFQPPKIVLFHKPAGVVVSKQDPHNKTIYDLLPDHRRDELRYIGRLDKDST